jgi:hypothetical protein
MGGHPSTVPTGPFISWDPAALTLHQSTDSEGGYHPKGSC